MPACGRPSARSQGNGLSRFHCRYHVQFKARHGSHWHPTYRAADLKPYLAAARSWLKANANAFDVRESRVKLEDLLWASRLSDPAMNLRGRSADYRAEVAFTRLREAGISADKLMAIYIAVCALIEDDYGSHRTREFRIVQIAKAVHRLASGTHRRWEREESSRPLELHVYPRSSGFVLRKIGERIERCCEGLKRDAIPRVIALRTERLGPHPSHLPGWKPAWRGRMPPPRKSSV